MKGTLIMRKSITKQQKFNERLVKKTLESGFYTFGELYNALFPKHFWQNRFTSWQKEHDAFFASFKTERDYFKDNYKSILTDAIEKETAKKQIKKSFLNSDSILTRKVFISDKIIITVYFDVKKDQTIGIYQLVKFQAPSELDWNMPGILTPSSFIGCFCIKNSKFKNFYLS